MKDIKLAPTSYRKLPIEIELPPDEFHVYWVMDGNENLEFLRDINYLHQLQNLYFALTGEELNIEL